MSEHFVLLFVGCLECSDPTEVVGVYGSEEEARRAFVMFAEATANPVVEMERYPIASSVDLKTTVALAGSGGSYWYPVQLHRVP